jgi:anti-sigma-K factor RskA
MAMTNPEEEPDAIEALLPWYAAGTLDASGRRRVEEALASRPELRASLRSIEEDRDATIALNESLGSPRAEVWTRVLAATASEPRRASRASRLASLAGFLGLGATPMPRRLAWAGAAAAIVILIEGATILALLRSHSRDAYQTASAEPKAGAEALIAFAPDARIDQISAFLAERGASIEEGPRGGMYRIRIGDKRLTRDGMTALLKSLSASPLVRTALPAGGD